MHKIDYDAYLEDDLERFSTKRIERKNRRLSQHEKRLRLEADLMEHATRLPAELQPRFTTSFHAAAHERVWLLSYLEPFYNAQIITDVLGKVKGGKEANVYCCAAHPSTGMDLIAAKVYRPRMFRNLRNDARYRQGRVLKDEDGKVTSGRREALAMQKNTRFGQVLRHVTWVEAEFQTMQMLYEAGADVPKPILHSSDVILMEYVGEERTPAATLNQVTLEAQEAPLMFARLVDNLAIMLACHRVHADFSAYNILYFDGQIKIIDFPQAVDPRRNPEAVDLFVRDVERLCQYFGRYQIRQDAHALADALWSRLLQANVLDADAELLLRPVANIRA
ncbi:MAG: hypothetical protein JW726_02650 [Anaerolineales bacterium]|nr:hypothetical protein [Anaerolineales bacterium]